MIADWSQSPWLVARWSLSRFWGDEDSVEVWTLGTPTSLYTYSTHKDTIHAVAWSSDSKRIASASDDGTVQVWDALTGDNEQIYQLP